MKRKHHHNLLHPITGPLLVMLSLSLAFSCNSWEGDFNDADGRNAIGESNSALTFSDSGDAHAGGPVIIPGNSRRETHPSGDDDNFEPSIIASFRLAFTLSMEYLTP